MVLYVYVDVQGRPSNKVRAMPTRAPTRSGSGGWCAMTRRLSPTKLMTTLPAEPPSWTTGSHSSGSLQHRRPPSPRPRPRVAAAAAAAARSSGPLRASSPSWSLWRRWFTGATRNARTTQATSRRPLSTPPSRHGASVPRNPECAPSRAGLPAGCAAGNQAADSSGCQSEQRAPKPHSEHAAEPTRTTAAGVGFCVGSCVGLGRSLCSDIQIKY